MRELGYIFSVLAAIWGGTAIITELVHDRALLPNAVFILGMIAGVGLFVLALVMVLEMVKAMRRKNKVKS